VSFDDALEAALERVLERRLRPIEEALRRIQTAAPDDLLSAEQASEATGYSVRTLRRRAKDGKLPGFKPPGSSEWRFRRGELLRALAGVARVDVDAEARKIAGGR
jgi:excisionase family DNA binding protein